MCVRVKVKVIDIRNCTGKLQVMAGKGKVGKKGIGRSAEQRKSAIEGVCVCEGKEGKKR